MLVASRGHTSPVCFLCADWVIQTCDEHEQVARLVGLAKKLLGAIVQGAILNAELLQPLWPSGPMAETLNQYFVPLVRSSTVRLDLVESPACVHDVLLGGSALRSIM